MTFSSVRRLSAFLACVFLYHALAAQSVQTPSLTVHAVWGSGEYASDLVPPGAAKPVGIEEYTFSADGSKLLIFTNSVRVWRQNTKGTFFVWDFAARRLIPVSTRPGYQQFAKFSPDGRQVAFVRDNNVYVTDLATGAEAALTRDGGENVINGTSDWVYEEELDLRDAFRWSPDGKRIAFWRLDQTAIPPFYLL